MPADPDTLEGLMSTRLVAVDGGAPLAEAAALMARHGIGAVLVAEGGAMRGIVTERDLTKLVARDGPEALRRTARDAAPRRELVTACPEATPVEALLVMQRHDIRRLPVERDGEVVGIVTERDVMKWLLRRPDVLLGLQSPTQPAVSRDALVALMQEMQLRPTL